MAIVRCERHRLAAAERRNYPEYALPLGYPDTAVVCGHGRCKQPGRVWLEPDEVEAHRKGRRVFGVNTETVKVHVEPDLFTG